ncbi:MAG: 2-oxoacid:acceptor oxidoreductase family protein [Candidatus Omnitrophota bacterium]|nr:2-oxoacid:acceptor oxidoreductase family protein [Candidatus Omnitrophota bacterium]
MREEILMSGFGGQGIMLMGRLLAYAAAEEDKFVTWIPAYGAEVRGGTAFCTVVISEEEIASPFANNPTVVIVMNEPSLKKYEAKVKKDGLLVINSSLAKIKTSRKDIEVLYVPATDIAQKLGNVRVANMAALAAYLTRKPVVKLATLKKVLKKEGIANKKEALLAINEQAIEEGSKYGAKK